MRLTNFLGLFLAFLLCSGSTLAQTLQWDEAPQLDIRINGQIDISTKAYQPEVYRPFVLIQSNRLSTLLLLDLGKKTVLAIQKKEVKLNSQYSVLTEGIPKGSGSGTFTVKGGVTAFSIGKIKVEMRTKESLVGEVSEGIILAHSPIYAKLRDAFTPKKSTINVLSKGTKKTEIVVLFATWCPTCKVVLPRFLRMLKDARNPLISVKYIGLAMGGSEPREAIKMYGHDYPAFIVYRGGKEIGRVIGDPPDFEASFLGIMSKN